MPNRKARDVWRVDNVVMSSTWKVLAKGLVSLMMDHSRLSGPEKRWTCNGPDCFNNVTKIVTWISRKKKLQVITQQLIKERKIQCDDTMMKSVETTFASSHVMKERVILHKKVYKVLTKDEQFLGWLRKQTKPIRKEVHTPVCTT